MKGPAGEVDSLDGGEAEDAHLRLGVLARPARALPLTIETRRVRLSDRFYILNQ